MKTTLRKMTSWLLAITLGMTFFALPATTAKADDVPRLTFCVVGNPPANIDEFYRTLDEMTIRDLGCTVDLVTLPAGGDRQSQYNLSLMTGEYDMYYSGNWVNHADYARKNAFYDITDLVQTVTPQLYANIPVDDWVGSRIDGRLYGVPQTTRDYSTISGFIYRQDLAEKYNLPPVESFEGIGDYLSAVLPNEPGMSGIIASPVLKYAFGVNNDLVGIDSQEVATGIGKYGIFTTKSSGQTEIVSIFDQPQYLEALKLMKQWQDEGLVNRDILSGQLNATDMMTAGILAGDLNTDARNYWGWSFTFESQGKPERLAIYEYGANNYKSRSGQTIIAISAKTKNIELCLKFLEKVHTDQEYYDLMSWGVKGVNYNLNENGDIENADILPENVYGFWRFWGNENMERKAATRWSGYDAYYDGHVVPTSQVDPLNGFTLDTSEISEVMAACEQIHAQYQTVLEAGITNDPEKDLAELVQKYKDAGIDKIIECTKEQLEAFAASKQ